MSEKLAQLEESIRERQLAIEDRRLSMLERLLEGQESTWGEFVDPREAYKDFADDEDWIPIGADNKNGDVATAYTTEQGLAAIRAKTRRLATHNEFAINGHENLVSYIVGTGLSYKVTGKEGAPEELVKWAKDALDDFLDLNDWCEREQEGVHRAHRDGETLIRYFRQMDGSLLLRFTEPEQLTTPQNLSQRDEFSFGIHTDPNDVETVIEYLIDGDTVPASDICHLKLNVTRNTKRGLPTFFPVRKNLDRAEKLLRNMSSVAGVQAAIAMIRQYEGYSKKSVEDFVKNDFKDFEVLPNQQPITGPNVITNPKSVRFRKIGPAEVLDAPKGVTYEFPAMGVNAANFVQILQAELRAIAARLVMPEFMFTSDASNAAYASTLVAEGPAVKSFQRRQLYFKNRYRKIVWHALEWRAAVERPGVDLHEAVSIEVEGPTLIVRDRLKDAQGNQILKNNGVISVQTWAAREDLDYEHEQLLREEHTARVGPETQLPPIPMLPDPNAPAPNEPAAP